MINFLSNTTAYCVSDTIISVSDNSTKTFIPGTLRLGISFGKKNKFTTGLDFIATKWSEVQDSGINWLCSRYKIITIRG